MTLLERFRGDTKPHKVTIKSGGVALPIAGFTFRLTVNRDENPVNTTNEIFSLTGVIQGGGAGGEVWFTPTTMQADQKPLDYFYDMEMTDAGSLIDTIRKGIYRFKQDISK